MGRRRIGGLKTRVGRDCSISRGGPDYKVEVYMSEESEESVTDIGMTLLFTLIHTVLMRRNIPYCSRLLSYWHIILSRLLFFLKSISIFSTHQIYFLPGRFTFDQTLHLFLRSIVDGVANLLGTRTIFDPINFPKVLTLSGTWPFFCKLFLLDPLLFLLNFFFCHGYDRMVFQNCKNRSLRLCDGVSRQCGLGHILFPIFINSLLASLPSEVSCSFYVDDEPMSRLHPEHQRYQVETPSPSSQSHYHQPPLVLPYFFYL